MQRRFLPALALAGLTTLMAPGMADAQTPQQEPGRVGEHARMGQPGSAHAARIIELRRELGLTDAQVEQIRGIQARLEEQNRPLTERLAGFREQMRNERPQIPAEQRAEMRARMHAERPQMTQEQREAMMERRNALRDSMRARGQQMTPEERAEMRERMGAARPQGEMRPRAGVAARAGAGMPEELRPVMEQLRTNNQAALEQVRSVLTAEQQQKLRELRPDTRQGQPGMRQGGGMQQGQPGMRRDGSRMQQGQPGTRRDGSGMRQAPRDGRGRVQGAAPGAR